MNREQLIKYIAQTYGSDAEYPWASAPRYAVFRHANNRKWFAVIMDISKTKLGLPDDETVDVMNIKCDPLLIGSLYEETGIFPAYHMNKNYWISVLLDGSVEEEKIRWLIDLSFDLTAYKVKKGVNRNV
ncbi:MAG: MmcQ/YjbR family DNA-binding protein [Clostridia bacterium]|nr:MmcQ/YjbR family DNA-binding protein [Clostridia bacterium]